MVIVVSFQEGLDLFGQKGEKVVGGCGCHQIVRNSHFTLCERKGLVAVQDDAADAKVGAAQVDGEIDTLQRSNADLSSSIDWKVPPRPFRREKKLPELSSYLLCSIGDGGDIGRNLAQRRPSFLQSLIHFPDKLLHRPQEMLFGEIEFAGDSLGRL